MGFFSWKTQDTNRSIPNHYSSRKTFTVFMHDNKGNVWEEKDYEGYGVFGGKDFYELVAEMNGAKPCRNLGISISFSGKPHLSPNLTETKNWNWINKQPKDCPDQGFFYGNDEEEIEY